MNGITDVKFCFQCQKTKHIDQMTSIYHIKGKSSRPICLNCYDETMEARKKAKLNGTT